MINYRAVYTSSSGKLAYLDFEAESDEEARQKVPDLLKVLGVKEASLFYVSLQPTGIQVKVQ